MSYSIVHISNVAIPNVGTETCLEWLCFNETTETWFLSLEKHSRFEFDLKIDAENVIYDCFDDDEFLTIVPIADRPYSEEALRSADYLIKQLQTVEISGIKELV